MYVEHLRGRLDLLTARLDRALKGCGVVIHQDVQAGGATAHGLGLCIELAVRIAEHHGGTIYPKFSVKDLAVRPGDAEQFFCAEGIFIERDRLRSALYIDVGNDGVTITLWPQNGHLMAGA
jgi:hypothetical protein